MGETEIFIDNLSRQIAKKIEEKILEELPHPKKGFPGIVPHAPGALSQEEFLALKNDVFFSDEKTVEEGSSGFRGLREFLYTIATNPGDKRLVPASKALGEDDPQAGGYLVPTEYQPVLIKLAIEKSKIFPLVKKVPMKTAEEKFPVAASLDESSGQLYGGIEFAWVDEHGTKTEKDFSLQEVTLRAHTCAALCRASNRLLEDSRPKAEEVIRELFSDAFANVIDNIIVNGTGAGQPLGILNGPCLYTVSKEAGQSASTIEFKNVMKMMMRMYPGGKDHSIWLINDDCLEQIWSMSLPVGTGGSSVMIASGEGDIKPIPRTLLGRPIIWTSHCKSLGSKGDIVLADPRWYLIGLRKALTIQASIHRYFEKNQTLFRIEARLDGQPVLPSTMKTRSNFEVAPFVTLAARS